MKPETLAYLEDYISGKQSEPDNAAFWKKFDTLDFADTYRYTSDEIPKHLKHADAGVRERATRVFAGLANRQGHATFPSSELFGEVSLLVVLDHIRHGNAAAELAVSPFGVLGANLGQRRLSEAIVAVLEEVATTPEQAAAAARRIGQWPGLRDEYIQSRDGKGRAQRLTQYVREKYQVDPDLYGSSPFDTVLQDLTSKKYTEPDCHHAVRILPKVLATATPEQKQQLYEILLKPSAEPTQAKPSPAKLAELLFLSSGAEAFIAALPAEWLTREFLKATNRSSRILEVRKADVPLSSVAPTAANLKLIGYGYTPKEPDRKAPARDARPAQLAGELDLESFAVTSPDAPLQKLVAEESEYRALRELFGTGKAPIVFHRTEDLLMAESMQHFMEDSGRSGGRGRFPFFPFPPPAYMLFGKGGPGAFTKKMPLPELDLEEDVVSLGGIPIKDVSAHIQRAFESHLAGRPVQPLVPPAAAMAVVDKSEVNPSL
jgi:hypothetical protein